MYKFILPYKMKVIRLIFITYLVIIKCYCHLNISGSKCKGKRVADAPGQGR